jgi:8-oxo-dGTP diphosphatase
MNICERWDDASCRDRTEAPGSIGCQLDRWVWPRTRPRVLPIGRRPHGKLGGMAPEPRQVVGAVVVDNGRAFVIRRSRDRLLFPGCWDVPGGHVEPGETTTEALARELEEETGWDLVRIVAQLGEHHWQGADGVERVEVEYLVSVEGDLSEPRLELDKHPEYKWVGPSELVQLQEGRQSWDDIIKRMVERGLKIASEIEP